MDFKIYYEDNIRFADFDDILNHLKDLGVQHAFKPCETGLDLLLISLSKNEVAFFEDVKLNKIKVERVS